MADERPGEQWGELTFFSVAHGFVAEMSRGLLIGMYTSCTVMGGIPRISAHHLTQESAPFWSQ